MTANRRDLRVDQHDEWQHALGRGQVLVQSCEECSIEQFPLLAFCQACKSMSELSLVPLHGRGLLVAATTQRRGPQGGLLRPPYRIGVAKFSPYVHLLGLLSDGTCLGHEVEAAAESRSGVVYLGLSTAKAELKVEVSE